MPKKEPYSAKPERRKNPNRRLASGTRKSDHEAPQKEGYYKRQATSELESERLAKQQADREKKFQAAKKSNSDVARKQNDAYEKAKQKAKMKYMNRNNEEVGLEFDPIRSTFLGEAEWKVKLKGLPAFYVPAKSAGAVRQMLRKQLKRPQDDIESVERSMGSDKKKDFRDRAAGRD